MNYCYMTVTDDYSKLEIFLFCFFGYRRLLKNKIIKRNNMNMIKIPLPPKMKEKHKKRYFTKLCRYYHEINVKNICFHNLNDDLLKYYIKTEFQMISGSMVFYEIFLDIISFFAAKKGYNLNECELIFISNYPKEVHKLILKCFKYVKNISVYTTNPRKFENLSNELRNQYGIFIEIKNGKNKVRKYNKIYINCEADRIVDEASFQSVNLIDIYKVYKGGFHDVLLSYKTKEDRFIKENNIVKNLCFTEYYIKTLYTNIEKNTIKNFLKENDYKIVNIKK